MAAAKFLGMRAAQSAFGSVNAFGGTNHEMTLMRTFEETGAGWFWVIDREGSLAYVSRTAADLFGASVADLLGAPFASLFLPAGQEARERLPFVLNRQIGFDRLILQSAHATGQWWEVSGRVRADASCQFDGYAGFCIDITERLASSQTASQLALFDALTGLPNRLNLAGYLDVHSGPGKRCAVMMIDLDRFKAVNDSLGHPAGDALLKQVALRLLKIVGDRDKIFRLGGDEFVAVLPGLDNHVRLNGIAQEIIQGISHPYSIEGTRCVIGASVGIAISPHDGTNSDDLTRKADLALYAAKSSGRGCVRYFSDDLLQIAEDRRLLEEDLRDALAGDELTLLYQPQVSTAEERVTGVEALIRWNHPRRGPISPAIFIPVAEEADLIGSLGEWIIRKACDDAAAWPGEIRVAVNVSAIQFASDSLPGIIASALAHSGLAPNRFEVELTESVFLNESSDTDRMFKRLKALGIRLALDDFGTGYSSLGYLRTAPFDKIKIDQSFVRDATLPGSRNGAIIAAIVALASALDMETTAEGVESVDQLDLMRDLGVSHIQGFLYSKAIASDTLSAQMADGTWAIKPTGPARQRNKRRTMYRKAGAILGGYYHAVIVRNMSETGALIEGLMEVPIGTDLIIDLGDGRLELAVVRRATPRGFGIEFGQCLVDDGNGNLTTVRVVTPYQLARHGITGAAQSGQSKSLASSAMIATGNFAEMLGLAPPSGAGGQGSDVGTGSGGGTGTVSAHQKVRALFAATNPLQNMSLVNIGANKLQQLTPDEWDRLKSRSRGQPQPHAQIHHCPDRADGRAIPGIAVGGVERDRHGAGDLDDPDIPLGTRPHRPPCRCRNRTARNVAAQYRVQPCHYQSAHEKAVSVGLWQLGRGPQKGWPQQYQHPRPAPEHQDDMVGVR